MIDNIQLESYDFSVPLHEMARKVAFLSDVFRHHGPDSDIDLGFHAESFAVMLYEIELDLKTINKALAEKWKEDHKPKD